MPSATSFRRPPTAHSVDERRSTNLDGLLNASDVAHCWTGQPVLLWGNHVPTASAATEAKLATGAFALAGMEPLCKHQQHCRCRRPRSDSGVDCACPASASMPERINPGPMQTPGFTVCCSSISLQKNLHRHASHKDGCRTNSKAERFHGSGSTTVDLVVDCTVVDVLADTRVPATFGSSETAQEHSAGTVSTPAVIQAASVARDSTRVELRQRVQQLEKRNRALEKKLKQLKEEKAQWEQAQWERVVASNALQAHQHQQQQQQKQQPEGSDRLNVRQLHVCVLRPVSIISSQTEHVEQLQQQEQQWQQRVEHVGVSMDTLPVCDVSGKEAQKPQQPAVGNDVAALIPLLCEPPGLLPPSTPEPAVGINNTTSSSSSSNSPTSMPSCEVIISPLGSADVSLHHQLEQQYQGTIMSLQRQVCRLQMVQGLLHTDYADLERVLQETDRQRRDYAARHAFVVLDHDNDGYISTDQVLGYELFASYSPEVLQAAFLHWHWQSGFPGYLNIEDFVRFVEYAEDRSSRPAQRFWFTVLDADGDGHVGWQDMKQMYDAVDKSAAAFVISFPDLMNQTRDMVQQQLRPDLGFTFNELWGSRLGAGVIGLLTNHNKMLLQRSTAEWGRGDFPL